MATPSYKLGSEALRGNKVYSDIGKKQLAAAYRFEAKQLKEGADIAAEEAEKLQALTDGAEFLRNAGIVAGAVLVFKGLPPGMVAQTGGAFLRATPALFRVGLQALFKGGLRGLKWFFTAGGIKGVLTRLAVTGALSLTGAVQWVVNTTQFLYNFDWNMSDAQIDAAIKANLNSLIMLTGGAFGQTMGWVLCGSVGSSLVAKFDPAMAAYVYTSLGEEALEELSQAWANILRSTVNIATKNFFLWSYKNIRRMLKKTALAEFVFGKENVAKWGDSGLPNASLATKVENFIESLPEPLQNFTEELLEEFSEACQEAAFVVAQAGDSWLALQSQTMREQVLGRERMVEVTPDRSVETEKLVISGNERVLMPVISGALATHQIFGNHDVGDIVGQPLDTAKKKMPHNLSIIVHFKSSKTRPWKKKGQTYQEATYTIPDVERSKIDWERIKTACGGENGFTYGPCRKTYLLSNGSQMTVWADTVNEAERLLDRLLALSNATVAAPSQGKQEKGGNRSEANNNYKDPIRLYPHSFTVVVSDDALPGQGRTQLNGRTVQGKKARFDLWTSQKPVNFEENLAALFRPAK